MDFLCQVWSLEIGGAIRLHPRLGWNTWPGEMGDEPRVILHHWFMWFMWLIYIWCMYEPSSWWIWLNSPETLATNTYNTQYQPSCALAPFAHGKTIRLMSRPTCGPQVPGYGRTVSKSKRIGRGGCGQRRIGRIVRVGHGVWGDGETSCGPRNHRKRLPARHFPLCFLNCLLGDTFDTIWSTPRRPSHRIHRSWNSSTQLYIRSRWAHFRVLQGVGDASRTVFKQISDVDILATEALLEEPKPPTQKLPLSTPALSAPKMEAKPAPAGQKPASLGLPKKPQALNSVAMCKGIRCLNSHILVSLLPWIWCNLHFGLASFTVQVLDWRRRANTETKPAAQQVPRDASLAATLSQRPTFKGCKIWWFHPQRNRGFCHALLFFSINQRLCPGVVRCFLNKTIHFTV